jgi:putative ABC transport system permease protein
MYAPFDPATFRSIMTVAVRSGLAPSALRQMITAVARADDPRLLVEVEPYRAMLEPMVTLPRFQAVLFLAFAGLGLLLTGVGIYGMLAFVVSRRTHEIGVRMALGASLGDIRRVVIRQALLPTAAGLGIGLASAYAGARLMERWLFEVRPHDPGTMAATTAILLVVAAAAMWGPARRASKVDPMVALRCD